MLFVLFQLGEDRYVIAASQIAAVLPMVLPKSIPLAHPAVAGAFNYRGTPVPLIDLSQLALGRPALARRSTRILVVHYPQPDGAPELLGLLAENVSETMSRPPSDFVASPIQSDGAPYLGPVAPDAQGLVQWVQVQQLLPEPVRALLFKSRSAS